MNPSIFSSLGSGLQGLGLAFIVGGLLALGAFTAPVLFKSFTRPEAGEAMTIIFRRYDMVLIAGCVLLVIGEVLRHLQTGIPSQFTFWLVARYVVFIALVGMTLYSTLILNPKMNALYDDPTFRSNVEVRGSFNNTHKLSEKLAKMELVAGVLLLLINPFIQPGKLP